MTSPTPTPTRGRPPLTSRAEVEQVAFELFAKRGFEATTVTDIADALGVGRRTVFHYFPSKNDIVWGEFHLVLERLRADLSSHGMRVDPLEAIARSIVSSNRYGAEQLPELRSRMTLITTIPALQAHSMLRYAEWRAVIADYVADRTGQAADALIPQTVAHATLGVCMAAFSCWVADPESDLEHLLAHGASFLRERPAVD